MLNWKYGIKVFLFGIGLTGLIGFFFWATKDVEAGSTQNVSGFAWSETTGWISFNSTDCDSNEDGFSNGVPPGCPGGIPTTGLIHYWDFEEGSGTTAADSVGGNDGALQNMDNSNWVAGPTGFGTALEFNGVDEYVHVSDDDSLSFGNGVSDTPFTFSAWVYMDDATNFRIISKVGDPANINDYEYSISLGTDDIMYGWLIDGTLINFMIVGSRFYFTPYEDQWTHVVMTYDGSGDEYGLEFYINGELYQAAYNVKNFGLYVAMENKPVDLVFAREGAVGSGSFADGKIDEIRMYNRVLEDWEIKSLYTGSPTTAYDYGVHADESTGELSGHAWSERLGWISFDRAETNMPPEAPYNGGESYIACLDFVSVGQSCDAGNDGKLYGWARALNACWGDVWNGSACTGSGAGDSAGGWDGWIKLEDSGAFPYSVTFNDVTSELEGWAWGDINAGWVSFNCNNDHGSGSVCGTSDYQAALALNNPPVPAGLGDTALDYCFASSPPIRLSWTFTDPDLGDTQSAYQVQIDDTSNLFPSPEFDTGQVFSSGNEYAPAGLAYNTTYYWRVKVWDDSGAGSAWVVYAGSFTTDPHAWPNPSNFTWSPNVLVVGIPMQFDDGAPFSGSSFNEDWFWDVDGDLIEDYDIDDPTHTYAAAGSYNVTLRATDDLGSCEYTRVLNTLLPNPQWKETDPF